MATMAGMDDGDGGWAQIHGSTRATATTMCLSVDGDRVDYQKRKHTTEQVGCVVSETPPVYPSGGALVTEAVLEIVRRAAGVQPCYYPRFAGVVSWRQVEFPWRLMRTGGPLRLAGLE